MYHTSSFLCLFCVLSNPTATPHSSTLSLHDALPISVTYHPYATIHVRRPRLLLTRSRRINDTLKQNAPAMVLLSISPMRDRKSTRLNSSHRCISYAVFCLKKKKKKQKQ